MLQTTKNEIVELTSEGVEVIQSQKNFYSNATKPIPLNKRDWKLKDMANL